MSGGEQQRIAIARALANNPKLILADEPTGNLDSNTGAKIIDLLKEINQQGTTILMVTHDEQIAKKTTSSIYMRDGRICQNSS